MCTVCGCGEGEVRIEAHGHAHAHGHPHDHSHEHHHAHSHAPAQGAGQHDQPVHDYGQGPARAHAPGLSQARMVQIEEDILMLLNKVDLLPYLHFDVDQSMAYARRVNSRIKVLPISAVSGEGMDMWYQWIRANHLLASMGV